MRNIFLSAFLLLFSLSATGQGRTEFVSFDVREHAERDDRAKNRHYLELDLRQEAEFEVPVLWLDRQIFVHVEGAAGGVLTVNGRRAGRVDLSPEEFDITHYVTDGTNRIEVLFGQLPEQNLRAFIHSQPKLRVADFEVAAAADSLYKYGILGLKVTMANGYNFPETVNVGYDVYDPAGKLLHFDNRDVAVPGNGTADVAFEEFVYGMPANLWTAANPRLHRVMIVIRHGKRYTEYIPLRVGFGNTEARDGKLLRNGKAVTVKALRYDATAGRAAVKADMAKRKKAGFNTLVADGPQPYWFYDLADEVGFYVFDQPESIGKANDPAFLDDYLYRAESMFWRTRNHTGVAGWSLGAPHGNGYNLQRTYLLLKELDPLRPVVYDGADGEWNTDIRPLLGD